MTLNVHNIWNACGNAFDRYTSAEDSFSENIERPVIERLLGEIDGQKILDLGCGAGPYSCILASRGARVTGLDLSEAMISLAGKKALDAGLSIDFRVADIRDPLPFASEELDLVFSATALHYVDDLTAFMSEVSRVIAAGGRFLASLLHPMSTASFPLAGAESLEGPDPWQGWYFGPAIRCIETPWVEFGEVASEGRRIFCHHHTIAEYFDAIQSAGMVVTRVLEPAPPPEFAAKNPARYDEAMRSPIYLILEARK